MGKIRRSLAPVSFVLALGLARTSAAQEPPLAFVENVGQCADEIRFQGRAAGFVASVLADGVHLDLDGAGLRLRFVGAEGVAEGRAPRAARAHFLGAAGTRTSALYGRVRLHALRPGVDLELYERDGRLEYDLVLAPGARAEELELALEGGERTWLDAAGALCATVGGRTLAQLAPVAWQEHADGRRTPVTCAWRALAEGRYGFVLGELAPDARLVIDPVLVYGTHVGGSNADGARATFVDESGAVYAVGWARSVDFPGLDTPAAVLRGKEAVLFKLAPDGRELVFATYLGGRGDDEGTALAVDADGAVLVAGTTASDDFPTTSGAFQREPLGASDGFVAKLSADGARVLFASRLGGSAEDSLAALAVTASGQLTLAGSTRSRDFPVSASSCGPTPRGGRDAFVARLDARAERLIFAARLGGSDDDEARALALDAEGCAYVAGRTSSHDFPTTLGAYDRERCGLDGFVAKLSGGGRTLVYSTLLGGSGQDEVLGLALDPERRAVVVGWTQSGDFPFDGTYAAPGRKDGFVARLSDTGNALVHATPLGGGSADEALGVALDPLGAAWVVGETRSSDFSVGPEAPRARLLGPSDAFLARVSSAGRREFATYLGSEGEDQLTGAHFDRAGTALVLCGTSTGLAYSERGPLAGKRRGSSDAYVVRFDPRAAAPTLRAGLGF
jgi:hypothetical protein